ncbi:DUF4403 family protein [Antarcticibacterium sp. 1MA-6-2]|uniref:DUF4403 family protein n=1 Tax=Antarcticibacterium sp. 1MA-6-2 TaxID=2908210 RepID=UPI001F40638C|nr:DUF4403 family protein [Antarcticibacterium sp. 1MA-6-2]UJH91020.1 DUF4403 family protein [Antarcticibacterium sp. 1MA-6-2]
MEKQLRDNIDISLPVKVKFHVLEEVLRERMVGENIQVEKENGDVTKYAKILDVSLGRSIEEDYDLTVEVHFTTLTSLFKNTKGSLLFHATVDFKELEQRLRIGDYKIVGTGNSWFMNKTLETVANSLMYDKLRNKMSVDFRSHIAPQLEKLNEKLGNTMEVANGVKLSGNLKQARICNIIIGNNELLVLVHIEGGTGVEITNIDI